jgi:hypothetical protein
LEREVPDDFDTLADEFAAAVKEPHRWWLAVLGVFLTAAVGAVTALTVYMFFKLF